MIAAVVLVAVAALNIVVAAVMIVAMAKVAAAHRTTHIMMEAHNLFPP
jgi:hypothetical protein